MIFENRKLYSHGQNNGIFLLQIPKMISKEMGLTKDTPVQVEYKDGILTIRKEEI